MLQLHFNHSILALFLIKVPTALRYQAPGLARAASTNKPPQAVDTNYFWPMHRKPRQARLQKDSGPAVFSPRRTSSITLWHIRKAQHPCTPSPLTESFAFLELVQDPQIPLQISEFPLDKGKPLRIGQKLLVLTFCEPLVVTCFCSPS